MTVGWRVADAGVLSGTVSDQASGAPIASAAVVLAETGRGQLTLQDGTFRFTELSPGTYTLHVSRIGYQVSEQAVTITAESGTGQLLVIAITLIEDPLALDPVAVEGVGRTVEGKTPVVLSGPELDAELGRTLADTIDDSPGLAQRSMGPAPARPVLRGLGGDRLLILEDGSTTGDLSASAPDHAVVIDPITSQEVKVVRGPASLRYGSSALAGVIDVERGYIPQRRPHGVSGATALQGESVNQGGSGSGEVVVPAGDFALRVDASLRRAGDIVTPTGTLRNTQIRAWSASAGASRVRPHGLLGVSANLYDAEYGIPGGFLGGHPNGVDIEADRRHFEAVWRHDFPDDTDRGRLERIEAHGTYSRYFHRELESSGTCGVSFGLLTGEGTGTLHFRGPGPEGRGFAGVSAEHRDYATGCLSFIVPTTELTLAGFVYDEIAPGPWRIGGSLRADHRAVTPAAPDTNKAGVIRRRSLAGYSGGLVIARRLTPALGAEFTFMRSFHPPSIEELFSDGPHLAAYSYEVGNADLDTEAGTGLELEVSYETERGRARASVYRNSIAGFIYPTNTGELEYGPGDEGFLPRYQFVGRDALFWGFELSAERQATSAVTVGGSLAYVRGWLRGGSGESLPSMPPLGANLFARLSRGPWSLQARLRGARRQGHLGEFEEPTAGYAAGDLLADYRINGSSTVQSVVLSVDNVTDAEYRNHLSRVRSVMPEPGRNLRLFYRVTFTTRPGD
jgi:iron complex outermembrane receptor protein